MVVGVGGLVRGSVGGGIVSSFGRFWEGSGERTVVGRAESRRVEFSSQDCAVGRYGMLSIRGRKRKVDGFFVSGMVVHG